MMNPNKELLKKLSCIKNSSLWGLSPHERFKMQEHYEKVIEYVAHKEEVVELHNLAREICLKLNPENPVNAALGENEMQMQLYIWSDDGLDNREGSDEKTRFNELWANLSEQERKVFVGEFFEYMFTKDEMAVWDEMWQKIYRRKGDKL